MKRFHVFVAFFVLALAGDARAMEPEDTGPKFPKQLSAEQSIDDVPDQDAVQVMRENYTKQFPELPESRNCMPQDVQGLWTQQGVLQEPKGDAVTQFNNDGREYLWFGSYNRFVHKRSKETLGIDAVAQAAATNQQQYIVSAKGMLYIYENYALKTAMLCFIASKGNDRHKEGELLLAAPVAEGKPLTVSFYALVAGGAKQEK